MAELPGYAAPDPALLGIDAALLGLRHLWSGPPGRPAADPGARGDDSPVEMSTVWIVDALRRAEAAGHPETTVRELASALDIAHSTASRLLDRAESAGMVTRARSAHDARSVACALTVPGRNLAAQSLAFRTGYLARLTESWPPQDRDRFAELLTRFADAAHGQPPTRTTNTTTKRETP